MKKIFEKSVSEELIRRINKLDPTTKQLWGKMNVSQMLAHSNVTYELMYEDKHPKPTFFVKLLLKLVAKKNIVNEVPYKKGGPTGPQFVIKSEKIFEDEKTRLVNYIHKTQELGENYFEQRESHSFGALSSEEWSNMMYKHLDHHLSQFGV